MKKITSLLASVTLAFPLFAYAQFSQTSTLIDRVGRLVDSLIFIVAGIALLVFFWGLVKFIRAAGSEEGVKEGKKLMLWGIIALFVMVSIWGIINLIGRELFPGVNYNAPNIRGLIPTR